MNWRRSAFAAALITLAAVLGQAQAAPFAPGNLVVTQIDFADVWGDNAGQVNLQEFTTTGAPVQTLAMPTTVNGANRRLTMAAGMFRQGHLSRSVDGRYLVMGGYDADVGYPFVATTWASEVNRVVGRVDWNGNIDTTTALTDCFQGDAADFRMVATTDGTKYWMVGKAESSGDAATRFATHGSTFTDPPGKMHSTTRLKDPRTVGISNGQLYISANTSGNRGVTQVGIGLPETGGQDIPLIAESPGDSASAYEFFFLDENTMYLADDRDELSFGGLEKFTFDGTNWVHQYTLNQGIYDVPGQQMLRAVTGGLDGQGNPVLYAITAQDGDSRLVTVTDTGPGSMFSTLATAPDGTVFRGVAWSPVPEPATISLLIVGAAWLVRRRR